MYLAGGALNCREGGLNPWRRRDNSPGKTSSERGDKLHYIRVTCLSEELHNFSSWFLRRTEAVPGPCLPYKGWARGHAVITCSSQQIITLIPTPSLCRVFGDRTSLLTGTFPASLLPGCSQQSLAERRHWVLVLSAEWEGSSATAPEWVTFLLWF